MDATSAILSDVLRGPPNFIDLGESEIAYWKVGSGDPLVMVHGYPVSGRTWRHVVAQLATRFTCYVMDLPGLGETRWSERTDFSFGGQARTLKAWIDRLGLHTYALMGHDTGGTIARRLATLDTARVRSLILIGTEIPNHRPPWIELFQKISSPKRTAVGHNRGSFPAAPVLQRPLPPLDAVLFFLSERLCRWHVESAILDIDRSTSQRKRESSPQIYAR